MIQNYPYIFWKNYTIFGKNYIIYRFTGFQVV